MKNLIFSFIYICFGVFFISMLGCQKDTYRGPDLQMNSNVKISSFTIGNISGTVNDSTGKILVQFPFGTYRKAVMPTIQVADGATVSPGSGTAVDLTNNVVYTVSNGNIYGKYTVIPSEEPAILSFVVAGVTATIDETNRTIKALVPVTTNLASIVPKITLATGATITPAAEQTVDFTNTVIYTVKKDTATVNYKVSIGTPQTIAFIGTASSVSTLANKDELAAWQWLTSVNSLADYVSLTSIQNGTVDLSQYKIIWWHQDESQSTPATAMNPNTIQAFKNYYANGGNLLLTSYATMYLDAIGIVPAGKAPNNAFGDNTPWVEPNWDWGISYKGYASHPVFAGLPQASDKSDPTVYLLSHGAFRLNHTAQWHIGADWGGYASPADWRAQTGGLDLGSSEGDPNHTNAVTMAEFPKSATHGATIVIGAGAYDWYSEADPTNASSQPANTDLPNIQKLTSNIFEYLSKQ
ncbi:MULTISPECIES: DUF4960 domain-containing protein [Chitinophagaceae]